MEISILDYGIGNIKSIKNAFEKSGVTTHLVDNTASILQAQALVVPGVGAFSEAVKSLKEKNMFFSVREFSKLNKPILGICLGMQLLFDSSTEFGNTEGLGLISGSVKRLKPKKENFKLPHISWNVLIPKENKILSWKNTILENIECDQEVYFLHSFTSFPKEKTHILSETEYGGEKFCSSVKKDNIYGCQFHPEKSGKHGLKIIDNFCKITKQHYNQ